MRAFLIKKVIKRKVLRACSRFRGKNKNKKESGVRILMYHSIGDPYAHKLAIRVKSENFKIQIEEIGRSGYKIVTLSETIKKLVNEKNARYLAVTFDDGYRDNFDTAAGILSDHLLKATFFITINFINGSVKKQWSDGSPREYMTWDDIVNLSRAGHEIGSHMLRHLDLRTIGNQDLINEFRGSKEAIEDKIKKPVKIFSCPYGGVNKKVIEAARNAGYISGCSSLRGINRQNRDPYILKRTEIDGFDTIEDFKNKLDGYYD